MPEIFDASKSPTPAPVKVHPKRRTRKENVAEAEKYSSVLREAAGENTALGAFCPKPSNVSFEVQHEDEPILLLLRQHPIVNVGWILLSILLAVAPLFLAYFPILGFFPGNFQTVAVLGWYA